MSSYQQQQQQLNNEEETTTFRSVPRAAGNMMTMPSLPPLGLRPLGAPKRTLEMPSKPMAAASFSVAAPTQSWKVDAAAIPTVPGYPLEITQMTCGASMPLDQITERIARVLQALNLDCLYHNQDDDCMDDEEVLPGRVDCKSKDSDLKFVVQLWRSHTQEIVVEVQRRRGSSMEFSAIRKPLFRSLQQSNNGSVAAPKAFSPPPFVPNKTFRVVPPSMMSRCSAA